MGRSFPSARIAFIVLMAVGIGPVATRSQQNNTGDNAIYAVKKKKPDQKPKPQPQPAGGATHQQRGPEVSPQDLKSKPASPRSSQYGHTGNLQVDDKSPVTERVLSQKLGSDGFRRLLGQIESMQDQASDGRGAPSASTWFDGARVRSGNDDGLRPSGAPIFGLGGSQPRISAPIPVISGTSHVATRQDSESTTGRYGSIPGGVVLEGIANGLGEINDVRYDRRFNALIFDDRSAYFMRVPPNAVALLCRAIAEDDRVGVSLGEVQLVYGKVPPDSDLAWDLKIGDHFLGNIVFSLNDWTGGYRFAKGFSPEPNRGEKLPVAVFFVFSDFQFQRQQEEARLIRADFLARLFPLSRTRASNGGLLPDDDAISQGRMSGQYESNAAHLAENIGYYRQEKIVDRIFAYGEVAAVLRELNREGFDLEDLADHIPSVPSTSGSPTVTDPQVALNNHWMKYLEQIQTENDYLNWSGPPLTLYRSNQGSYYNKLGNYLSQQGKIDEARAAYEKSAELDPVNAALPWSNLGITLYNAGRPNDAIDPLSKATQLDPKNAQAWYLLGITLTQAASADWKQNGEKFIRTLRPGTVEAFKRCIEADPNGKYASQARAALEMIDQWKQ